VEGGVAHDRWRCCDDFVLTLLRLGVVGDGVSRIEQGRRIRTVFRDTIDQGEKRCAAEQ